jgi:hypothetical protein
MEFGMYIRNSMLLPLSVAYVMLYVHPEIHLYFWVEFVQPRC